MQYLPQNVPYPNREKSKLSQLETLFRDWHQHFATNGSTLKKPVAEDMVFDGFYPYYFSQKIRILFIGWEAVDIPDSNYVEVLYPCYRTTKDIGGRHLNQSAFHYRMICIAYGLVNEMPPWSAIDHASRIGDTLGEPGGLSFAFINISKLSNAIWRADHAAINMAHGLSIQPRNFIEEEIAILEPHIVIAMCRTKRDLIASLGQSTSILVSDKVDSFSLISSTHRSLLLNTWHFAARKSGKESFYDPICNAVRGSKV